jgi:hypothetical protein
MRWRLDKVPRQCTMEQLQEEAAAIALCCEAARQSRAFGSGITLGTRIAVGSSGRRRGNVAADRLESVFLRLFGMTTRTMIVDRRLAHAMAGPVAVRARRALALHDFDFP